MNSPLSSIKNISFFCGNIPDQHFNFHLAKNVWFLNSSNILWSTLQVSRGIFISSFICEPLMSRLGSSMLTSPSPLSLKMSPTSLVFGSHRYIKFYFLSWPMTTPGSDWLLRRVVRDGSRGLHPASLWPRGNHQVVQLWRCPVPQQPKLPQLHQVTIIFETWLEILFTSGPSGDLATSSFRLMPTISCWNLSLQKEGEVQNQNLIWVKRQKQIFVKSCRACN